MHDVVDVEEPGLQAPRASQRVEHHSARVVDGESEGVEEKRELLRGPKLLPIVRPDRNDPLCASVKGGGMVGGSECSQL